MCSLLTISWSNFRGQCFPLNIVPIPTESNEYTNFLLRTFASQWHRKFSPTIATETRTSIFVNIYSQLAYYYWIFYYQEHFAPAAYKYFVGATWRARSICCWRKNIFTIYLLSGFINICKSEKTKLLDNNYPIYSKLFLWNLNIQRFLLPTSVGLSCLAVKE